MLVKYAKDFKAEYGKPAGHFGGHAWDAFMLVVDAIKKVGLIELKLPNI